MDDNREFIFHNSCIGKFNENLFKDIFTEENISSKKKVITVVGEKYYGYYMEKNRESYFVIDEHYKKLPFRTTSTQEIDFKGDVFTIILGVEPITISAEQKLTFRQLIDLTPNFKHTHPLQFLLYKICYSTAWIDRVNFRVSTDAGFGKDSVANIIQALVDSTANLYGATFAKLEFVLRNKLIVLNELGNLKGDDKVNFQEFLLATGGYFDTYTKRSRKSGGTQEQYDISALSLVTFYNLPEYYTNKAQEYFDQMFTKAVCNRFIPFAFDGVLITEFENLIDVDKIVDEYDFVYKDVIATLTWYRQNNVKDIKYNVDKDYIKFSDKDKRYSRSFNIILKYVAEYCETQEEFNKLSKELYGCYLKYLKLIDINKEAPLKFEDIK